MKRGQYRQSAAYGIGFLVYLAAAGLALWNAHIGVALSTALWVLWGILECSDEKTREAPPAGDEAGG